MKGCIPVLVTPFYKDKVTVDFIGIKNLVEYFIRNGVKSIWALGTGSEDYLLSNELRYKILEYLSKEFSKRINIYAGVSFLGLQETINFLEKTNKLNLAGIHYINYNNLIGEKLIYEIYKEISLLSKHPIWLYSSANWGRKLTYGLVKELSELPNIYGCKFSTSNIVEMEKIISLNNENFQVIPAVVRSLLGCLSCGTKAATTVEACAHLEKILPIYDFFEAGDIKNAYKAQAKLNRHLESLETSIGRENFLKTSEIKSIIKNRNLCERYTAKGLLDLNENEYKKLISCEVKWIN